MSGTVAASGDVAETLFGAGEADGSVSLWRHLDGSMGSSAAAGGTQLLGRHGLHNSAVVAIDVACVRDGAEQPATGKPDRVVLSCSAATQSASLGVHLHNVFDQ